MKTDATTLLPFVQQEPEIIWTWDPDGYCDYFNQTWTAYTGVPVEDLIGTRWLAFLHLEDQQGFTLQWLTLLEIGAPFRMDLRIRSAAGQFRRFRAQAIPMRETPGRIAKWFGSGHVLETGIISPSPLETGLKTRPPSREKADFSTDGNGMLRAWSPGSETLLSYHEHQIG